MKGFAFLPHVVYPPPPRSHMSTLEKAPLPPTDGMICELIITYHEERLHRFKHQWIFIHKESNKGRDGILYLFGERMRMQGMHYNYK